MLITPIIPPLMIFFPMVYRCDRTVGKHESALQRFLCESQCQLLK